jgi:adenylate cyclase
MARRKRLAWPRFLSFRFAWPRGVGEALLALAVATSLLYLLGALDSAVLRGLETASLDLRFRLRGVKPAEPETVVVLVDDRSLTALGRWPLSRRLFSKALQILDRDGARVIGFDLLFAEPEAPVPQNVREAARSAAGAVADPQLRSALSQLAEDDPDGDFAKAIQASGKVLLPVAFSFVGPEQDVPGVLTEHVCLKLDPSENEPLFPLQPHSAVLPVPALANAASGIGHVNVAYDRDGEPRYDYLVLPFSGDFIPSLAVRAAAAYLSVPWHEVSLALGDGMRIGDRVVPTDPAMRFVVNYRGPRGTIPTYSFLDLVEDRVPPQALAGKVVLVGASFIGIPDTNPAPFDSTPVPGTERLANIVDTILAGDFIRENPPPWPAIDLGAVLLLALAIGAASAWLPTRFVVLAGTAPIVAWLVGAQIAFDHGLWLPIVNPGIALAAATATVLLVRYALIDRQRRGIQGAFRHYLAPDLVNELSAHPERLQLGGETRMLTIMFSDIRGFTSISESFKSNPQGLSRLINRGFLSPMTALIMARRGTIDKYMGDCIMAFWNAPLDDPRHADNGCDSALAMLHELERINRELEVEAEEEGRVFQPLHIGVGVNTGECVVGNMGSDERFAYTAMGDAVNLASRLEGQTKTYGVFNIIGETTRAAASSWAALELDLIAVKGKHDAVRIYTLLGDAGLAQSAEFRELAAANEAMLQAYRVQDWDSAETALDKCQRFKLELAGFYNLYAERIAHFRENPPGPEWNGVFVALEK